MKRLSRGILVAGAMDNPIAHKAQIHFCALRGALRGRQRVYVAIGAGDSKLCHRHLKAVHAYRRQLEGCGVSLRSRVRAFARRRLAPSWKVHRHLGWLTTHTARIVDIQRICEGLHAHSRDSLQCRLCSLDRLRGVRRTSTGEQQGRREGARDTSRTPFRVIGFFAVNGIAACRSR